jgi:hypothetical protein
MTPTASAVGVISQNGIYGEPHPLQRTHQGGTPDMARYSILRKSCESRAAAEAFIRTGYRWVANSNGLALGFLTGMESPFNRRLWLMTPIAWSR